MTNMLIFTGSIRACSEPPQIPHAVIIRQRYQEIFPEDAEVQYECEHGYTVEGDDSSKSIFCMAGNWTAVPTCSKWTKCRHMQVIKTLFTKCHLILSLKNHYSCLSSFGSLHWPKQCGCSKTLRH